MMPDPWATYKRPSANEGTPPETSSCVPANKGTKGFRETRSRSATRNVEVRSTVDEALDFYVKATGMDGTQKRQELVGGVRGGIHTQGAKGHEQLLKGEREEGARVVT